MKFEPRPYGNLITEHILNIPRCSVFAGMGLGKTVSALNAIVTLNATEGLKTLVIAPLRVALTTWPNEVEKWDHTQHLSVSVITGTPKQRERAADADADIYTINYELLPWLVSRHMADWKWGLIVCDESTKLKGFRTKQGGSRAKALSRVAHRNAERLVLLTGTPAPNGYKDLWGQFWFVDKGERLGGSFTAFMKRWFSPIRVGSEPNQITYKPMDHAQKDIEWAIADVTLTIRPEDWYDLEKTIVTNVECYLTKDQTEQYETLELQMMINLSCGNKITANNAAALTIKCLQYANGAMYTEDGTSVVHDHKIQALESIIDESGGAPVLVAYHFKSDLERLLKAFPEGRHLDKNPKTIEQWNAGEIPILFAHPASAGHGLNLQYGGNIVAFFGHWWNLEEYQQMIERIGPVRQMQAGFKRPVFVYHIVTKGTVDEDVLQRRDDKKSIQDSLLERLSKKYETIAHN